MVPPFFPSTLTERVTRSVERAGGDAGGGTRLDFLLQCCLPLPRTPLPSHPLSPPPPLLPVHPVLLLQLAQLLLLGSQRDLMSV